MKHYLKPIFIIPVLACIAVTSVQAESEEKMVIALKTDSFELTETDISSLGIGESQTIETDSGKVIDILRTADGAEIYVDGELLEMNFDKEGLHEEHMMQKHVEIICDSDEQCDKNVFVLSADDKQASSWVTEDGETVVIHKEVGHSCTDDSDTGHCAKKVVRIYDDGEAGDHELHELLKNGEGRKVIVVKKEVFKD